MEGSQQRVQGAVPQGITNQPGVPPPQGYYQGGVPQHGYDVPAGGYSSSESNINSEKQPLIGSAEAPPSYTVYPSTATTTQPTCQQLSQFPPVGVRPPAGQVPPVQYMQPGYGAHPQPYGGQIMSNPPPIPGCPPGLEYLAYIDQLLIHQQIQLIEALTSFETQTRFLIKNSHGQQVYFAGEESDLCSRQCCGSRRGFVIHITDNLGMEVIRVNREFKCCACCPCCAGADCCANEITIESPPGVVIGKVKQQVSWLCCTGWKYGILDANDDMLLEIDGPVCMIQCVCCPDDLEFMIRSPDGCDIGKITKQYGGMIKETFTNADNFGISFPMNLDIKMKAVILGAVFLIDFMFFERRRNRHHHHAGHVPMNLDIKMKAVILGAVFLIDFMFFERRRNRHHHHAGHGH